MIIVVLYYVQNFTFNIISDVFQFTTQIILNNNCDISMSYTTFLSFGQYTNLLVFQKL